MHFLISRANRIGNRSTNQDRATVFVKDHAVLLVLGDGLGGQPGGDLAAECLVQTASDYFNQQAFPIKQPARFLQELIILAHEGINTIGRQQSPPITPGTTAVLCLLQGGHAWWCHVGDSRLYLFRPGEPHIRTLDHSVAENLIQGGELDADQLRNHPKRHIVTRCLGITNNTPVPSISSSMPLQQGDIILLCSDGLWEPLTEEYIANTILSDHLHEALNTLSEQAELLRRPQSDNISAVAIQIKSLAPKTQDDVVTQGDHISTKTGMD